MTAKEMLEELGYELTIPETEFEKQFVEYFSNEEDILISFCLYEKTVFATKNRGGVYLNTKTLAAICQQVKELGWLDD